MRQRVRVAIVAVAVAAMTVGVAPPAGAQEEPAALGFAVSATQGPPGQLVLGQVDTDDVAEHCTTDLEEFQARFGALNPVFIELVERFLLPDQPEGPANLDQVAFLLTSFAALGIQLNVGGAAEQALPQTFVMTFADIATQEPVGEMGNFDPDTGEGSVVVPDIAPGLWAVAAACVGPSLDFDVLEAGIRTSGDFLQEIGMPPPVDGDPFHEEAVAFMQDFTGSEATGTELIFAFIEAIGPTLIENIVAPDAFGAVVFCIHNAEGVCPGPEPPGPPGEPIEPATPGEEPTAAQPVVAAPSFTG